MRRHEIAVPEPLLAPIPRRSVVIFVGVIVVLLAPWPRYGRLCAGAFSLFGNGVVRVLDIGGPAEPRFSVPTDAERRDPEIDDWTVMLGATGEQHAGERMPLSTRILGYTPFAILLALLAAAPMPGRRWRNVAAIAGGMLLVRLAAAIALPVSHAFGHSDRDSGGGLAAEMAWTTLVDQPALSYVSPLLSWGIAVMLTSPRRRRGANRKS